MNPVVLTIGLTNVDHVQLTDLDCEACGRSFDHRIAGDELGMVNDWTIEAVTELTCPHCGFRVRWTIEEELLHGYAELQESWAARSR